MPLESGQTLQHYRLVEKIGEGGMGVVWKARDTRLDRDVALKVLPAAFADNAQRLARFEREAKAVAALAHPNILAVYDIGHAAGSHFMVTELLDGDPLSRRLRDGPLPARKAADLARQVARGLAAAHEKGFVHRDLKPDNVYVTNEGRAKILDFGLAGPTGPTRGSDEAATHTPTATELTSPGTVMGTADYMSPEQVRGEAVDHRSDIFSFGSLLHEMLTGRRPFHRETVAETMTAVLREDPSAGSDSATDVPGTLERVVQRCLEKRPEERFQSASDLAFAVDNALAASTSAASLERIDLTEDRPTGRRRRWWLVAVAGAALFAAGALVGRLVAPEPASQPAYSQLTFRQGIVSTALFTGDGQTVVYAADWDGEGSRLWTVTEGSPESRPLGVDDAEALSVSSRGELALLLHPRYLLGWSRTGTLARMPMGGGAPREMLAGIGTADWDRDGKELAIVRIQRNSIALEYPPGNLLYESAGWIGDVRFSPDGRRIAFADHPGPGDDRGYVAVTDLDGNARRLGTVWSSLRGMAWSPDGREIWYTAGERGTIRALHAVDLSGNRRVVSRAPADLILHDISPTGRVLVNRNLPSRGLVGRPPGSKQDVPLSWLDWTYPGRISPDGNEVVFTEQGEGGGSGYGVYLRSTTGDPAVRLGSGQALDLSPDGTRVLAREIGESGALLIYPTGAGEVERIEIPNFQVLAGTWIEGTRRIFLTGWYTGESRGAYLFDPQTSEMTQVGPDGILPLTMLVHRDLDLAVARDGNGAMQLFPYRGGGEPRPLPTIGPTWRALEWSPDGRSLYLTGAGSVPLPVARYDIERDRIEPLWELMPSEPAGLIDIGPVLITPDARAYAYSYRRFLSTLYLAEGF